MKTKRFGRSGKGALSFFEASINILPSCQQAEGVIF